jgi:hypothetical protein
MIIDERKFIQDENIKYFSEFVWCLQKLDVYNVKFQSGNYSIIFQTEQMSYDFFLKKLLQYKNNLILDYSKINISILSKYRNNLIHCPVFFIREFLFDKKEKEYDFVMIGHFSERRKEIYLKLKERGYNILNITNEYDMKKKYDLILRAKCLVNIHTYEDCKIFEFARCAVPVYNNMNVISETSIIDLDRQNLSNRYITDHVLFCDYGKLIDTCISNLDREISVDYAYLEKISKFEINRINKEIKKLN